MQQQELLIEPVTLITRQRDNSGGYRVYWKCPTCGKETFEDIDILTPPPMLAQEIQADANCVYCRRKRKQ